MLRPPHVLRLGVLLALVLAAGLTVTASAGAAKQAKSLGPTPLAEDCKFYRGPFLCYQNLWSGRFEVDKHIVSVGDTLNGNIQVLGGFAPVYSWSPPGAAGIAAIACPLSAPTPPEGKNLVGWSATCTFKAVRRTDRWVVFGPSMGLATSGYPDEDYYAVIGNESVSGRVLDSEGKPVARARVSIKGPADLFAVTDNGGHYNAIDIPKGKYTVSLAGRKGFCVDSGEALSRKSCKPSRRVDAGNVEVNFKELGKYSIEGTVEDQWDRGIGGIEVKVTGAGFEDSSFTDEHGRYNVGVEGVGPWTVAPVPANRGPNEAYYYIKEKDAPTAGITVEVNFPPAQKEVQVDWELDRTLQMRGPKTFVFADGQSRLDYDLEVLTQVGTRVKGGVPLRIVNAAGGDPQSSITCWDGKQVLPNADFNGTKLWTDDEGLVRFTIYPGETPVFYAALIHLVNPPNDKVYFSPSWSFGTPEGYYRDLGTGEQLNQDLRDSIFDASGDGTKPSPMPTDPLLAVDWLAQLQRNSPKLKGLSFGPVHGAFGGEAVAIWPLGKAPKVNPDGSLSPSPDVRILDETLFRAAVPTLPTIGEWMNGSPLTSGHGTVLRGTAADPGNPQTFFGWPKAIASNEGLQSCLGPHPFDYSSFEVHSPVDLLFTDASGKRFGVDARGASFAEIGGTVTYDGEVRTFMLPKGAYKIAMTATGKGPVAIASTGADGTSTVRFNVKKGQKASLSLKAGAPLGSFTIGGTKVTALKGVPTLLLGLPKRVKALQGWRAKLRIVDAVGDPIPGASLEVLGDDDLKSIVYADAEGKVDAYMPALAPGRAKLTVRAPGRENVIFRLRAVR